VQPLLHELRRGGWGLGVLSNFDSRLVRILAELELDDQFDFVLLPRHTGIPKPDTAAFTAALVAAGISPPGQESGKIGEGTAMRAGWGVSPGGGEGGQGQVICVHVGDSVKSDICGAVGAGLFGILVDRRGKWVNADGKVTRTPPSFPPQRAAIVPSFAAVAAVGLGFGVQGSGFRVQGLGFRVAGPGVRVPGSGVRVSLRNGGGGFVAVASVGLRFRIPGSRFRGGRGGEGWICGGSCGRVFPSSVVAVAAVGFFPPQLWR